MCDHAIFLALGAGREFVANALKHFYSRTGNAWCMLLAARTRSSPEMNLVYNLIFIFELVLSQPIEGSCRSGPSGKTQEYASGYWQDVDVGSYICVDGGLQLATNVVATRSGCANCVTPSAASSPAENTSQDTRTGIL